MSNTTVDFEEDQQLPHAHRSADAVVFSTREGGTTNAKFEREFENVVKALRTDDAGREAPPAPML